MEEQKAEKTRSIYRRGADDGFPLGLLLAVIFVCMAQSIAPGRGFLNAVAMAGIVAVPFLTYRFLRRTFVAAHGLTSFSALWMQGIVMFACASLIMAVVSFVYMRWIVPDFMETVVGVCIDVYRQAGTTAATQMADDIQALVDQHALPSPADISLGWLWLGIFSGSILSVFVALIVRIRRVPIKP